MIFIFTTDLKRKFKVSPQLDTSNKSSILAGASYIFDLDERFIPYDDVTVVTLNSSEDCTLIINGHHEQPLPKGTEVELNYKNVRQLKITNDGTGTIAIDKIKVIYQNTGHQGRDYTEKGKSILEILGSVFLIKSTLKK